jgi:hypothetical protein
VLCNKTSKVAAHHVLRKSVFDGARFEPGNGATLCGDHHDEAHDGFNGRADLSLPLDHEGGEKLEGVAELFRTLAHAWRDRYPLNPEYYYLSDRTLSICQDLQGNRPSDSRARSRIELAWLLWDRSPQHLMDAVIRANLGI